MHPRYHLVSGAQVRRLSLDKVSSVGPSQPLVARTSSAAGHHPMSKVTTPGHQVDQRVVFPSPRVTDQQLPCNITKSEGRSLRSRSYYYSDELLLFDRFAMNYYYSTAMNYSLRGSNNSLIAERRRSCRQTLRHRLCRHFQAPRSSGANNWLPESRHGS